MQGGCNAKLPCTHSWQGHHCLSVHLSTTRCLHWASGVKAADSSPNTVDTAQQRVCISLGRHGGWAMRTEGRQAEVRLAELHLVGARDKRALTFHSGCTTTQWLPALLRPPLATAHLPPLLLLLLLLRLSFLAPPPLCHYPALTSLVTTLRTAIFSHSLQVNSA